jgi:TrmH family RNA methyltransferase
VEHISSRQNPLVKRLRDLARDRDNSNDVLLDGPHLVQEALDAAVNVEVAVFAADAALGRLAPLAVACAGRGARVVTAPESVLLMISPVKQPAGVVALARLNSSTVEAALTAGAPQLLLLLDHVQDPGNVGAIIRAAEACGATAVIAGPGTADPFGWKALRGSMGSAFRLPVATTRDLDAATDAARAAGLRIFAAVPRGGTLLARAGLARPSAILLGGEGPGLREEVRSAADETVTIPMQRPVESLNVATAAALILYEASRQRLDVTL